jgi:hypothetical protein
MKNLFFNCTYNPKEVDFQQVLFEKRGHFAQRILTLFRAHQLIQRETPEYVHYLGILQVQQRLNDPYSYLSELYDSGDYFVQPLFT